MAPNKRGGTLTAKKDKEPAVQNYDDGVISNEEVAARGSGTEEDRDTYDSSRYVWKHARMDGRMGGWTYASLSWRFPLFLKLSYPFLTLF